MQNGDAVAVFDSRAHRWCRAEIISVNLTHTRATIAARDWAAVLPLVPEWVRPVAVVRA
jgi:hypothetical protein